MSFAMRVSRLCIVALALCTTALPTLAAECKPLGLVTSLPMKFVSGDRPGVDITIVDATRPFLVDTGGVATMVVNRLADELKLPTARARAYSLNDVAGNRIEQTVRIPSIVIGRFAQRDPVFFVYQDDPEDRRTFDGILAPDFLRSFDLDFDFAATKLNLMSPDHCKGQVVYWKAPVAATVPFQMDRLGHITLQLQLDGKKVRALLDTGASETVLDLAVARRDFKVDVNAPDIEKIGELKGGYTTNVYLRRFNTLSFGNVTISNPTIQLISDMMSGAPTAPKTGSLMSNPRALPPLILGMSVLKQLHLYIAYNERNLYVTAAGETTAPQ
jgi:predicted aspartyl protease